MKNSILALAVAALVGAASFASANAVVATQLLSGSLGTNGSTLTILAKVASNDTGLHPAGGSLRFRYDSANVTFNTGSVTSSPLNTTPGSEGFGFSVVPAGPNTVSGSLRTVDVGMFGSSSANLVGSLFTIQFTVVDASINYAITVEGTAGGTATLSNDLAAGASESFVQIPRNYNSAATTFTSASVADWTILD